MYDERCDGTSQSPIDITKSVSLNQTLTKIELTSSWDYNNFQDSSNFKLENKGYTALLTIDRNEQIISKQNGKTFHEQLLITRQEFPIKDFFSDNRQQICSPFIKNP